MPTHINKALCNGCGICLDRCGKYVYARKKDGSVFSRSPKSCVECTLCVSFCPTHAISMVFIPQKETNNAH